MYVRQKLWLPIMFSPFCNLPAASIALLSDYCTLLFETSVLFFFLHFVGKRQIKLCHSILLGELVHR